MKRVFCKICNVETKYSRRTFAKYHLLREHNLGSKGYYDLFKDDKKEGECRICNKPTFFRNIEEGYNRFCSNACSLLDVDVSNKKIESAQKKREREKEKYNGKIFLQTRECIDKIKAAKEKKYGNKNYCNVDKVKKTKKEKYGNPNYCNVDKIKKTVFDRYGGYEYTYRKTVEACKKKYGTDNYFKTELFRDLMEATGQWVPLKDLSKYEVYKRKVRAETKKWAKQLYNNWDGNDYYNGQKLVTYAEWKVLYPGINVSNNKLQPSIDHKISVSHGFVNGISHKKIGNIENLCICSRDTNVRKNYKTDKQYNKIIKRR